MFGSDLNSAWLGISHAQGERNTRGHGCQGALPAPGVGAAPQSKGGRRCDGIKSGSAFSGCGPTFMVLPISFGSNHIIKTIENNNNNNNNQRTINTNMNMETSRAQFSFWNVILFVSNTLFSNDDGPSDGGISPSWHFVRQEKVRRAWRWFYEYVYTCT